MKKNLLALTIAVFVCGCSAEPSKPTGPTYAEAVTIYQAEVALLDSLLAKVDEVNSRYKSNVEKSRKNFSQLLSVDDFDRAAARVDGMSAEHVTKLASEYGKSKPDDLVDSATLSLSVFRQLRDTQISDIGVQIAKQKLRVADAEKARELATP